MPGGGTPLGFVYFAGVKFIGYTAAAFALRRAYPQSTSSIVKIGGVRTTIGIGAGLLYGLPWFFWIGHAVAGNSAEVVYLVGLVPIRILEWLWLLHLLLDRGLGRRGKAFAVATAGTAWSYCLDLVGIAAAFVIPGGAWIC